MLLLPFQTEEKGLLSIFLPLPTLSCLGVESLLQEPDDIFYPRHKVIKWFLSHPKAPSFTANLSTIFQLVELVNFLKAVNQLEVIMKLTRS